MEAAEEAKVRSAREERIALLLLVVSTTSAIGSGLVIVWVERIRNLLIATKDRLDLLKDAKEVFGWRGCREPHSIFYFFVLFLIVIEGLTTA